MQVSPPHITQEPQDAWIGKIAASKHVVDVCVFEPVSPGSNQYAKTSITTPVLCADLRAAPNRNPHRDVVDNQLSFARVETASGSASNLYELATESKQLVLSLLVNDGAYVEERVNELQDTQDSSAWTCAHCTCINVPARVRCGTCRKARQEEA